MLRPMLSDDADAVVDVMRDAFAELERSLGQAPPAPTTDRAPDLVRIRHLVASDPAGAWVTVGDDGVLDGAALAILREGLWGVSLLVVRPDHQSTGRGSALLGAAAAYGAGSRGGLILASQDARALRAYWRVGCVLRPAMEALGPVKGRPPAPPRVRAGRWPADRELVDAAGRAVRGAGHGSDAEAWLASGQELLIHDDGGFAVLRGSTVRCLAATDERVARELLQAALHAVPAGADARVSFIDGRQDWAFDEVLAAGLILRPAGAIAVRGDVGPLHPYIPSGAYL